MRRFLGSSAGLVLLLVLTANPSRGASPPTTTLVYPPWSHCYGLHRVSQTHLTLRAGFRYKFDDPQGLVALKLDAEDDPKTARDDDELTVFGANSGQNQIIYNTSITAIAFYGREGSGEGEFRRPHGIGADRAGHVVVADTGNDRLHVLQYADDRLRHVRFIGGTFDGRPLRSPLGVALENGLVYVCDPPNARILVLDLEGRFVRSLSPQRDGKPLLQDPFSVAAMGADAEFNYFGDDFVVVTDSANARLWQLDRHGKPLQVRRIRDVAPSGDAFDWAAIDYHGNVYCSDRGGRLHKFDHGLRYLLSIGRPGTGDYEFDEPRGIGLYRRFGQMFVAERQGAQYLWLGTDVFTPSLIDLRPDGSGGWNAVVRYFLTEYAQVALGLVDAKGGVRVELQPSSWTAPGRVEKRVRFRIPAGSEALRLQVVAVPLYSSRKILKVEKYGQPVSMAGSR